MSNVTTPEFRGVFLQVFKAGKPKTAKAEQLPNFSVRAAFPPTTDFSQMKAQAEEAVRYKWPEGAPKSLRSPFRRNDELDKPIDGIPDDWIIMTFARREQDGRPAVFDHMVKDIEPLGQHEVYSGAYYKASVRAYGYVNSGNKGVSFGLQGLQKIRNGDPLGKQQPDVRNDFAPVKGAATAGGVFD